MILFWQMLASYIVPVTQRTRLGEVTACAFILDTVKADNLQNFCVQTGKENHSTPDFPVRTPALCTSVRVVK